MIEMDATDRRILMVLQRDGRKTNSDLATEVGLSPSACHRRVQRLEDLGVIRGYVALLDARKLERLTTVSVEDHPVRSGRRDPRVLRARGPQDLDVLECHLMAGSADYLLKVVAQDTDDFARIHRQRLAKLPGVAQMHSSFSLRTVAFTTALPV